MLRRTLVHTLSMSVMPVKVLAAMTSMGLVFALYFALPNLSRIGITYFEFLTIRPTFFGLLQQGLDRRCSICGLGRRCGVRSLQRWPGGGD